jgi:hypothetical protein
MGRVPVAPARQWYCERGSGSSAEDRSLTPDILCSVLWTTQGVGAEDGGSIDHMIMRIVWISVGAGGQFGASSNAHSASVDNLWMAGSVVRAPSGRYSMATGVGVGVTRRWVGRAALGVAEALRVLDPEGLPPTGLRRVLSFGAPSSRIRAAREIARRGDPAPLVELLEDGVPGVRRAAARGLGWLGSPSFADSLESRLARERSDTVAQAVAGAWVRCGGAVDVVAARVQAIGERRVGTWYGPRVPGLVTGSGSADLLRGLALELGRSRIGAPRARADLLAEAALLQRDDPHGPRLRDLLPAIAAACPADLLEWLDAHWDALGRYSEHAFVDALGHLGDPRAMGRLDGLLRAMDTDPGRGFKHRRLAATALGRMGDPSAVRSLVDALEREALEFEGRPGAGLGIQFPVRVLLLWALGEVGDSASAPLLASYLENTSGSATGGFHLPAIGALLKLGPAAAEAVAPLLDGPEVGAANAAGVLAGLGPSPWLARAQRDPREAVRAAAGVSS